MAGEIERRDTGKRGKCEREREIGKESAEL